MRSPVLRGPAPRGPALRGLALRGLALCLLAPALPGPAHAAPRAAGKPAAGKPAGGKPATGRLVVLSTTTGAGIFIDGQRVGAVPADAPFQLTPGPHRVRVELRGYGPYDAQVDIVPGRAVEVEADLLAFAGVLVVETPGVTAAVHVDGQPVGSTPFEGDVTIGTRDVEVSAPGRHTYKTQLVIKGGQMYPLSVTLKPDPGAHVAAGGPGGPGGPGANGRSGGQAGARDGDAGRTWLDAVTDGDWYTDPLVIAGAGIAVLGGGLWWAMTSGSDGRAGPPSPAAEATLPITGGFK